MPVVSFSMFSDAAGRDAILFFPFSTISVISQFSVNTVVFFLDISSALLPRTWSIADSASSSFVSDLERGVLLVQHKNKWYFFSLITKRDL